MAKELIEKMMHKFIPDPEVIKRHKSLQFLGQKLHDPNLWHINRRSICMAFAVGLFGAWIPTPGQMAIAAAMAIYFRANIPISVALVWLTNPITMPPLFYFAYQVGLWSMNLPASDGFDFSLTGMLSELGDVWQPFLMGCFVLGVTSAAVGYFVMKHFWAYHVKQKWQNRHKKVHKFARYTVFHSTEWRQ
jgi:uncharacterized protein (DUF2062 family)